MICQISGESQECWGSGGRYYWEGTIWAKTWRRWRRSHRGAYGKGIQAKGTVISGALRLKCLMWEEEGGGCGQEQEDMSQRWEQAGETATARTWLWLSTKSEPLRTLDKKETWGFPGRAVVKNRLPMQGTWVRSLVREDPTHHGATKPVCRNYWAWVLQLLTPARLEPVLRSKRSHCNEKPAHHNEE